LAKDVVSDINEDTNMEPLDEDENLVITEQVREVDVLNTHDSYDDVESAERNGVQKHVSHKADSGGDTAADVGQDAEDNGRSRHGMMDARDDSYVPPPHSPDNTPLGADLPREEEEEEHVRMEAGKDLIDYSSKSGDETYAQPIVEDASALKHARSTQTDTAQLEDIQHEQKQEETVKASLRRRGRAKKLMTFEEATMASQILEPPSVEASEETQTVQDKMEIEAEEEDDESLGLNSEADGQIDDMSAGKYSVDVAEKTANYLLDVLAESSKAVAPTPIDEQTTTTETLSTPGVAGSADDKPDHDLSSAIDDEDVIQGHIPNIDQLKDEAPKNQPLAQSQPEEKAIIEEAHLDVPLPVQTPVSSRKQRSRAKSTGRKSAVPSELRGWFSPREEAGEPAHQEETHRSDPMTTGHNGEFRQNENQRMPLVTEVENLKSSHVDRSASENVRTPEVQESNLNHTKLNTRNTKQARKSLSEEVQAKSLHEGFQTALSYYTPLSNLHLHLNRISSHSQPNTVDVLAIVSSATSKPCRATSVPRDYFTTLKITTPPAHGKAHIAFPQTQVQIFRPVKDVLPIANVGDAVLLRDFIVKSDRGKCFLLSTASSSWCVWRFGRGRRVSRECLGPPVELGDEEEEYARALRKLWVVVDKDEDRDVEREEEINGHMG